MHDGEASSGPPRRHGSPETGRVLRDRRRAAPEADDAGARIRPKEAASARLVAIETVARADYVARLGGYWRRPAAGASELTQRERDYCAPLRGLSNEETASDLISPETVGRTCERRWASRRGHAHRQADGRRPIVDHVALAARNGERSSRKAAPTGGASSVLRRARRLLRGPVATERAANRSQPYAACSAGHGRTSRPADEALQRGLPVEQEEVPW